MRLELVRDWMSREVATVDPETPVTEAGHILVEKTIRRLPVVADGKLVGIVTYGDLRSARPAAPADADVLELNYLLSQLSVADVMTDNPITVGEDETIGRAAQLMLNNMIGGLPVVNSAGDLVGIITESDIFRLVVRDWMHSADDESEPYAYYG